MDRRAFIGTLARGLLAAPLAAEAQPSGRVARVGVLSVDVGPLDPVIAVFNEALNGLGWIVGLNLLFEGRWAGGQLDRLPELAAELVRYKVDMILTNLNHETLAARRATASIPIIMARGIYPEQAGLVASLAHPGGNVTGTTVGPVTSGKYLQLLKEAVPKLYGEADRSGLFTDFTVVTPTYYREPRTDPWVVARIAGTALWAIIARWEGG